MKADNIQFNYEELETILTALEYRQEELEKAIENEKGKPIRDKAVRELISHLDEQVINIKTVWGVFSCLMDGVTHGKKNDC